MPRIENELLPTYGDRGFSAVAVHKGTALGQISLKLLELGITLPLALDLDGEVFRYYRKPRFVFPLNILIGRDGKVVHTDTELPLDQVEAAIIDALEE